MPPWRGQGGKKNFISFSAPVFLGLTLGWCARRQDKVYDLRTMGGATWATLTDCWLSASHTDREAFRTAISRLHKTKVRCAFRSDRVQTRPLFSHLAKAITNNYTVRKQTSLRSWLWHRASSNSPPFFETRRFVKTFHRLLQYSFKARWHEREKSILASCPSVYRHVTARLPLDGFT